MNKKTRKRMKDYPVASPMWWEAFEEEQKEFDRLQVRFNRIFVGMLCIPLFAMLVLALAILFA